MDDLMHRRARRAYELGRLRHAAVYASVVVPLAALSHTCCLEPRILWLLCGACFVVILAAVWRGRAVGAGARGGLLAGLASWVLPVVAQWLGLGFSQAVLALCFGGGLASGLLVGVQLRDRVDGRGWFLASATLVAGLTGALGCVVAGAGGLVGMLAGEILGALPLAAMALRRQ